MYPECMWNTTLPSLRTFPRLFTVFGNGTIRFVHFGRSWCSTDTGINAVEHQIHATVQRKLFSYTTNMNLNVEIVCVSFILEWKRKCVAPPPKVIVPPRPLSKWNAVWCVSERARFAFQNGNLTNKFTWHQNSFDPTPHRRWILTLKNKFDINSHKWLILY